MKILYVCNDFPFPPHHGGLLDMWNRIQALRLLGVSVDLIATVSDEPSVEHRRAVEDLVDTLTIVQRKPLWSGLLSLRPTQVSSRCKLRSVRLNNTYDVVLMQSEFTTEILANPSLQYRRCVIRVDNDEPGYFFKAAKAERSIVRKAYYWQEGVRLKRHSTRSLREADMLWFVSHDELSRYTRAHPLRQNLAFVPAGVDTSVQLAPPLEGAQVLFVGSLWVPLNRRAIEWYIREVHPLMADVPDYSFAIVGSTNGKGCAWLRELIGGDTRIATHLDEADLKHLYLGSSVFVNPMQDGAGVKLKTIEAALRGLPVISTDIGAEGSGLINGEHYIAANSGEEFARAIRNTLRDRESARKLAKAGQQFVLEHYDQARVLNVALAAVAA